MVFGQGVLMEKTGIALLLIILLSIVGVARDFFIKLSGNGPKYIEYKWFILGLAIYASTAFGWFFVMKEIKLATLGAFYAVSIVLLLTAVGVFYFGEKLNYFEMGGIAAALVSVVLLMRFA